MIRKISTLATALLAWGSLIVKAQNPPTSILQIDIDNWVQYLEDTTDRSLFATAPTVVPASAPRNFASSLGIADIVAVNGAPAKGTMVRLLRNVNLSQAPNPGQGIGDIPRGALVYDTFELQTAEGVAVGTLFLSALVTGPPAPGAPLAITQGNFAILGGTGAFLGARGQNGQNVNPLTVGVRLASVTEDPANRRRNGGGRVRWIMHVIPMQWPEVRTTPNGPAVVHSQDFGLVTPARPAAPGEIVSLLMTGLGPTRPGVDPGQPFPADPLAVVNSPIAITVNGRAAEVIGAAGYPGSVDGYQVNVRIPTETERGRPATLQVSAAWIVGPEVRIPIQ